MHRFEIFLLLLLALPIAHASAINTQIAQNASPLWSAYIYAPAVMTNIDQGTLTKVLLNAYPGNGNVTIAGPASVGASTLQSAETAVAYACSLLNVNESKYNFSFLISDKNVSVSGPSGGLAFTLVTISALTNKPLLHNFTVTGTIQPNGTVGLIGGIFDKVEAAKSKNLSFVIAPYAQNGSEENLLYYISQQYFGIPIVEAKNVSQAEEYAFGIEKAFPLTYDIYTDYYVSSLPYANISCTLCNNTPFEALTNYTFNYTESEVHKLNSSFSSVKNQMLNSLIEYRQMAAKGYLYASADLSFLTYLNAFAITNSGINKSTAEAMIQNASSYCSSINPPQINSNNYEYVIGGEVRQGWANETISNTRLLLNSSETSDGIIESMYSIAPVYGWCSAAEEMYRIANSINGTPVSMQNLKNASSTLVNASMAYGNGLYTESAINAYKNGKYGAAYYDAVYASIFENTTVDGNYTISQLENKTLLNLHNTVVGIWPEQFMAEAQFYINEANMQTNSSISAGDIDSAYTSALLAEKLSNANLAIRNSFVPVPVISEAVPSNVTQQLSNIESEMSQIYLLLFIITALLFVIFVFLLLLLLDSKR